jgi:cyclomaltodextrinase / maltogenic alpha-amylase / neopullulanase
MNHRLFGYRFLCSVLLALPAPLTAQNPDVPAWVRDAIFYQIFPERFANGDPSNDPPGTEPWGGTPTGRNYFGGDIQGIIDHLGYLSELGINTIYLNPVFESTTNHKYHTKDYYRIDPHFGSEELFTAFIDSCHARDIRVVIDAVFNHTGRDFFAFDDIVRNGARSNYLGWYNVYGLPIAPAEKPNYECWWGLGDLPKLMTTNPDVRSYLFGATTKWMNAGIDGWRLDVPNEVPHQFWRDWRALVKGENPAAYIVGEIWGDASPWLHGDQFDAVMNYLFRNACIQFLVTGSLTAARFDSSLAAIRSSYPAASQYALQNLLGSHDTERFLTLCKGDIGTVELAWLFQMTYVGAPMIYYGDEIGMTGPTDPGSRHTMIWKRSGQNRQMLSTMKSLIALRRSSPALRRGDFRTLMADSSGLFGFERSSEGSTMLVVLNASARPGAIPPGVPGNRWRLVWQTPQGRRVRAGSTVIPARSGVVFERREEIQ